MTKIQKEGIKKALEVIREQGLKYRHRGLSPLAYFAGMINITLTALIVGRMPEIYWLLHLFKCIGFLAGMYYIRYRKKELLYFLEFCWFVCHAYLFYSAVAFVAVLIDDPETKTFVSNKYAFYIYWGVAHGPLAFGVVAFKNALILHELENLASCFIHLTPALVCWSMRWFVKEYHERWPGVFGIPELDETINFFDLVVPPSLFYITWWVLYCFWMSVNGMQFVGKPDSKYENLYHWNAKGEAFAKFVGYDKENKLRLKPFFIYMYSI